MSKKDNAVQKKLLSIILVWIAFVVLYFMLQSGNEMMMWVGLAIMAAANGLLFLNN